MSEISAQVQSILSWKESLQGNENIQSTDFIIDTGNENEETVKQHFSTCYQHFDRYIPERLKDYRHDYGDAYLDKCMVGHEKLLYELFRDKSQLPKRSLEDYTCTPK